MASIDDTYVRMIHDVIKCESINSYFLYTSESLYISHDHSTEPEFLYILPQLKDFGTSINSNPKTGNCAFSNNSHNDKNFVQNIVQPTLLENKCIKLSKKDIKPL